MTSPAGPNGCVTLVYDGADRSHLEVAIPHLDLFGLKGTFLLEPTAMLPRAYDWQSAANEGHEMGCHCLLDGADPQGNLPNWTLEMVEAELRENRRLLTEFFPRQSDFAFAYPGPETGGLTVPYNPMATSYRHAVQRVFGIARSAIQGMNDLSTCDFGYLMLLDGEGLDGEALGALAAVAAESGQWAIIRFRGIGVGTTGTDAKAHETLCRILSERPEIECTTLLKAAYRFRSARDAPAHSLYLIDGQGR